MVRLPRTLAAFLISSVLVGAASATALAQSSPDVTATPTELRPWYLYIIGWPSLLAGGLFVLLVVGAYLRYAPRFHRDEAETPARGYRRPGGPTTVRPR